MKCPKCQRPLQQSGEVELDDEIFPVYQCDECLMQADFGGEKIEIAFTFAVAPDGSIVYASDPSKKIQF